MAAPRLPDIDTLRAMGFKPDQVDKLCRYLADKGPVFDRVDAIKKILRKNDRQQFVNRYKWINLPNDLTGEFIERVLYYKYSGIYYNFIANSALRQLTFLSFLMSFFA